MTALLLSGCSAHPEEPLLERFFEASRLRDRTALQSISTVIFEPRDDGIVTRFDITNVTQEERGEGTATKNVTLKAPVKLPDGRILQKTLTVTMEKRSGNWLVTGVASFQR